MIAMVKSLPSGHPVGNCMFNTVTTGDSNYDANKYGSFFVTKNGFSHIFLYLSLILKVFNSLLGSLVTSPSRCSSR